MSEQIKAFSNPNIQFQIRNAIDQENYIMSLRSITLLSESVIKENIKDLSKLQLQYLKSALAANDFEVAEKHFRIDSFWQKFNIARGRNLEQKELKGKELAQVKKTFNALSALSRGAS